MLVVFDLVDLVDTPGSYGIKLYGDVPAGGWGGTLYPEKESEKEED